MRKCEGAAGACRGKPSLLLVERVQSSPKLNSNLQPLPFNLCSCDQTFNLTNNSSSSISSKIVNSVCMLAVLFYHFFSMNTLHTQNLLSKREMVCTSNRVIWIFQGQMQIFADYLINEIEKYTGRRCIKGRAGHSKFEASFNCIILYINIYLMLD